jgi:hypothetical protein
MKMKHETAPEKAIQATGLPITTGNTPGGIESIRPLRVRSISSSLRLLGRVLFLAQKGLIDHNLARLLIYGCQVYSGMVKDNVIEERLAAIETELKKKGSK